MAKFTSTADLNIRLPGGNEFVGAAGTTHRLPDSLVEEFERDFSGRIPGFAWVEQDETTDFLEPPIAQTDVTGLTASLDSKFDKTGGTISGAVTATGAITGATLSATGAIQGASVSATTVSADTARFKGWPHYDPKAYGALGDDVTDDTVALQAALTAAHPGGKVNIPAGTYVVSSTLVFPYRAVVAGAGPSATVIRWAGATNGTVIQLAAYTTAEQKPYSTFEGFGITGSQWSVAMDMKGLTHSRIAHIKIDGSSHTQTVAIKVDGSYGTTIGAWWNTIENCHIWDTGTGILFTGVDNAGQANTNTVRDTLIHGHTLYGINVDIGDNVLIQRVDVTSDRGGTGVRVADDNCSIRELRCESAATAVLLTGEADCPLVENCLFVSNTTAIVLESGATRATLRGNKFVNVTTEVTDGSTTNASNWSRRGTLVPFYFVFTNAVSNATDAVLSPAGLGSGTNVAYYVGRNFDVRGISFQLTAAVSGGSITVRPRIGASASTNILATSSASTTGTAFTGMGKDEGTTANTLSCLYSTSAAFAPSGSIDILATVWVEFTDE